MDIKAAKNAIKAILTSITGSGQILQASYGYPEPSPSGYPCAIMWSLGSSEERADTINNLTRFSFAVRILTDNGNTESGYDALLDAVKEALDELRKDDNDTLSGTVLALDVSPDITPYFDEAQLPIMGMDIRVDVRSLSPINT